MQETCIEWIFNPDGSRPGWSWSPITGCLNHVNGLCKGGGFPCYAYRLANGRLASRYTANRNTANGNITTFALSDPFYPRFWPERLYHPWGGEPKGIFVCDMSDLFGIGIPEEWTRTVLELCRKHEQNRYYLLTKQPAKLLWWSPFPDNCYVGVTATNTRAFVEACNHLVHVKAKVIYLSLEPLLEWHIAPDVLLRDLRAQQINWLIIGAQTKPTVLPKIEWVKAIVEAADRAGVPVFLKDNLEPMLPWPDAGAWAFRDFSNMLRQEFPNTEEDAER